MRRAFSLRCAALLAGALVLLPVLARADDTSSLDLDHINLQYHGGPLMEHVRVATLFWGSSWREDSKQRELSDYMNAFFQDLFTDGRFMANLAQYSAGGYTIGNGEFIATVTDEQSPPARVTDGQIQSEIRAQVAAGHLPKPDANTLYVVFTPPQVVVVQSDGENSEDGFLGYHNYCFGFLEDEFAYAVIPYYDRNEIEPGNPRLMTDIVSHELAEAVTDPQVGQGATGWWDEHNGEVSDITVYLYYYHRIGKHDVWDVLEGTAGRRYLVEKSWSNRDNAPVAFAPVPQAGAN
jgi:hypothetical protein